METVAIAYLILAHKQPEQLTRMIRALHDFRDYFFVHCDSESNLSDFECFLSDFNNVLFIQPRYRTNWGDFGLVEATLSGLQQIKNLDIVDHVIMLSGQDYPIKSKDYIRRFIMKNKDKIFMEYFPIPDSRWSNGGEWRFPNYDKVKSVMKLYCGSQWISLPRSIIEYIAEFIDLNPAYIDYFRRTKIPDESFFQTMFFNWEVVEFERSIESTNLHLTI